jgi:hypothetical protein
MIQWKCNCCFPESRHVHVKTKQVSKNLYISNTKKKFKQHGECPEIGLIKNKKVCSSSSSNSLNSESITEVLKKKKAILIVPSWKGQIWTSLLKSLTISTIPY